MNKNNSMLDLIPLQKKSFPPYTEIEEGFGYRGVVLWDPVEDKVQCAICGEMFDDVAAHVRTHKMSTKEYRERCGLNTRTPLSNMAILRRRKEIGTRNWNKNLRGKLYGRPDSEEGSRRGKMRKRFTDESDNARGNCPAQLIERFQEECERLDKIPTKSELPASIYFAIYRRWGGYNRFLEAQGIPLNSNQKEKYPEEII